jgi:hypothetical protein
MSRDPDQVLGRCLATCFRHESRRSFLSRLTRALFALAGVELASRALPFAPGRAAAADGGKALGKWAWCCLHGFTCEGNCNPKNGNMGKKPPDDAQGAWWVACCQNPASGMWQCLHYADYCGRRGPNWGKDCKGTETGGLLWCGWGADRPAGRYICTDIYPMGEEKKDLPTCLDGCKGGVNEGPTSG